MIKKFLSYWVYAFAVLLFFVPFQTRLILQQTVWNGGIWEYGTIGIFGTEILLWIVILWYAGSQFHTFKKPAILRCFKILFGIGALWIIYQLHVSQFIFVELQAIVHIVEAIIIFYLFSKAGAYERVLQWSFLAGLAVQAVFACVQFFTQNSFVSRVFGLVEHVASAGGTAVVETVNGRWLRAYGAFPHPNILGGYMAIGALMCAYIVYTKKQEKTFICALEISSLLVLFILFIAGLVVSFSRSALIAFVCGLLIMTLQRARVWMRAGWQAHDIARRISIVWLSIVLVIGSFGFFMPDIFLSRVEANTRLEQKSISERITSYKTAREIGKRIWFLGTGLGNYTAQLYEMDLTLPCWDYQPVHNAFVLAFLELGFLMVCVIIWFLFSFAYTFFVAEFSWLIVALGILGLFDHYLWSLWSGLLLCAVVFAVIKLKKSDFV